MELQNSGFNKKRRDPLRDHCFEISRKRTGLPAGFEKILQDLPAFILHYPEFIGNIVIEQA